MQEFSEAIVDEALVELLTCSAAFREWFLATTAPDASAPYRDLTFRGATRSVTQGNGESDVVAEWSTPADERILILVEDKLTAGFQKHQGKRYAARAAQLVADGIADTVRTVLLAPAHYLQAANPEAMEFEVRSRRGRTRPTGRRACPEADADARASARRRGPRRQGNST
ncbi:MAG: hypothetical protein WD942_00745 [Dehalococcoidia bacterium]